MLNAGGALRQRLLALAASILQATADALDIADGAVVDAGGTPVRMSVADLARIGHFRPGTPRRP